MSPLQVYMVSGTVQCTYTRLLLQMRVKNMRSDDEGTPGRSVGDRDTPDSHTSQDSSSAPTSPRSQGATPGSGSTTPGSRSTSPSSQETTPGSDEDAPESQGARPESESDVSLTSEQDPSSEESDWGESRSARTKKWKSR